MALLDADDYREYILPATTDATDDAIEAALARYQSFIEAYIQYALEDAAYTESYYQVSGQPQLSLLHRPVISLTSVTVDGTAVSTSDIEVDLTAGVINNYSREISGDVVTVVYTAGYATCPADLKYVLLTLANGLLEGETGGLNALSRKRRETIFGVASVDYEPERSTAVYGASFAELGPYVTILDNYRRYAVA